ncbi:MAG: hypothetical protein IT581_14830 [Verrucomicrobiales bacterium]|nr:hypothetical protein [Verrucomicrobiales bacterium]
MVPGDDQLGFDFNAPRDGGDGYSRWQSERQQARAALARKLGFPIGHTVEVELKGEVILRGVLHLADDELWVDQGRDFRIRLRIERCIFTASEIERCVRLD